MNNHIYENSDLINALKQGEAKAYSFLVDHFHHKLCIYAFSLCHDDDIAKDIVQNVFISIWKRREDLNPSFNFKNLLYKSVYNEFIDHHRKRRKVLELEKKYIEGLSTIIEEDHEKSLEKLILLVKQEIENLPKKCKQTFLLSKRDGLTNIEISEYLNVSIKAVEANMTKAFKILRKSVGDKTNSILFILFDSSKKKILLK
ncbi:RNA polymerase sigma factor [Aestuariibaculum sp. M13]|uniref:RNA polymerase sigma factor n=1 Tax=Aestuariibaculum sp. M13 TaxID=2967132 RepID=UPI002159EAED|nr:RNA polymerase sigma factor [Aestuariibaculum sp. M13]MCR8668965.1 RNA polymerase sigma factor [Aestuariibaculum sp. M13]